MPDSTRKSFAESRVNMPTGMSSREIAQNIPPEIRARAFFSARVAESHILERFRQISDAYSSGEISRDEARHLLRQFARENGRDDGTKGLRNLASTARLNLILDQNAKMARAVAQYEAMHRPANLKIFPYVIYRASVGSRSPRDSHRRYDGMIIDKRDPWLRTHWPPWEFGCNCDLENCSAKKAATLGTVKPMSDPEDVKIESESGFAFNPALGLKEFDYNLIKDQGLREEAREGVDRILTGRPEQPGNQYRQSAANGGSAAGTGGAAGGDGGAGASGAGGSGGDRSDQSDKSDQSDNPDRSDNLAFQTSADEKQRLTPPELTLDGKSFEEFVEELESTITPELLAEIKKPKTREQCVAEAKAAVPKEVMQATDDYVKRLPKGALLPLFRYTDKDKGGINRALRRKTQTAEEVAEITAFSKLLENGPKFHGMCFRGCYFKSEADTRKFVKAIIERPKGLRGFTSLSPDFETALYYALKGPAHVIIVIPDSSHGVYWGPYSSQPRDHETTLDHKFYLKGLEICEKGGKLYVLAKEMER